VIRSDMRNHPPRHDAANPSSRCESSYATKLMPDDCLKRALERHRDDDPPRLEFSVPLDRLMDTEHCRMLAADIERVAPYGWEIVKATATAWRKIPASPGLYIFVWQPTFELQVATPSDRRMAFPWVLYVGKAGDGKNRNTLKSRYKGEYAGLVGSDPEVLWSDPPANREDRLRHYLSIVPLQFWYCAIEDGSAIHALEKRLFTLFAPPLNMIGSPRLRPVGKPRPAF